MIDSKLLKINKHLSCDTIVIGGGSTGIAAAIASIRNGADTMLIESQGYLGGTSTIVPCWMGFHARTGEMVVKGIALELMRALQKKGGATEIYLDPICGSLAAVNTHWWKIVADEEIQKNNVNLLLHSRFITVEKEHNKITGVYLLNGDGIVFVKCRFVIDCTDTGIVALEAGEELRRGRDSDGKVQVSSWTFDVGNIDFEPLYEYFVEHPDDLRPFMLDNAEEHIKAVLEQDAFVTGAFGHLVAKAEQNGMRLPRCNMPGVMFPHERKFVTVASRVEDVDPLNSQSYTNAERVGFSQAEIWLEFLKKYVPGFKDCTLSGSYGMIGVRETNHLQGEYILQADDLLNGREFHDSIALGAYHLDIHSPDHGGIETRSPQVYTIPYRALLPRKTANLLIAGRCISATHEAQASTRVIPIGMAEGEAAGTAAAICVADGGDAPKIDVQHLQDKLTRAGALIYAEAHGEFHKSVGA